MMEERGLWLHQKFLALFLSHGQQALVYWGEHGGKGSWNYGKIMVILLFLLYTYMHAK